MAGKFRGMIKAPKNIKIRGQSHELSYINPEEQKKLLVEGGSGEKTKYGVKAYAHGATGSTAAGPGDTGAGPEDRGPGVVAKYRQPRDRRPETGGRPVLRLQRKRLSLSPP